jgi:hypothetical protein
MSADSTSQGTSGSSSQAATPTVTCRVCGTDVPAGAYCGFCGGVLSRQPGQGPDGLRLHTYGAAQAEHVLRLSVVSSLFPHLAHRSRAAFRWGLAALIVVLVILALLRWQGALVAVSALGFPLLFLIYLEESDVYGDDDLPLPTMLLTAALGAVLGVGWALVTDPIVARSYAALGPLQSQTVLRDGLIIPIGGALLMLVPAMVVRLFRPRHLESLDGFLIGSLGAVAFTAAATLVRLAPQLAHELVARRQPLGSLLTEASIQGVAVPLTAAAAGGVVGAALWYMWQGGPRQEQRTRLVAAVVPAIVVVVAVYAAVGLIDIARLSDAILVPAHLLIAAGAVLALRIGIHLALLKETREVMHSAGVVCAECHQVVPDTAFCPYCGVSARASSRTSRQVRRLAVSDADDVTKEQP